MNGIGGALRMGASSQVNGRWIEGKRASNGQLVDQRGLGIGVVVFVVEAYHRDRLAGIAPGDVPTLAGGEQGQ